MTKLKQLFTKLFTWLKNQIKQNGKSFVICLVIAEVIFWLPNIITGFLALFIDAWWWTAFGAIIAFWSGPFTPAIPLQIALAYSLHKIWRKITNGAERTESDTGRDDTGTGTGEDERNDGTTRGS